jgi:hypothetical protein
MLISNSLLNPKDRATEGLERWRGTTRIGHCVNQAKLAGGMEHPAVTMAIRHLENGGRSIPS